MRTLYSIFACTAVLLLLHGAARAGSIYTPILSVDGVDNPQFVCIANNVSAQTQQVTVNIFDDSSTGSYTQSCELAAGDPAGCRVSVLHLGEEVTRNGYCQITAPGATRTVQRNIRGALLLRQGSAPPRTVQAVFPAQ
jgi:hypothetical protein